MCHVLITESVVVIQKSFFSAKSCIFCDIVIKGKLLILSEAECDNTFYKFNVGGLLSLVLFQQDVLMEDVFVILYGKGELKVGCRVDNIMILKSR